MKRLLMLFAALVLVMQSYAQYEQGFTVGYPERYRILDSIGNALFYGSDSVAVLSSYERLRQLAREHDDKKAQLIADKLEFTYHTKSPNFSPGLARQQIKQLLAKAKKADFQALEASLWANYAHHCYNRGSYADAFDAYFHAYDLFKDLSYYEFRDKAFILFSFANCFYRFGDYRNTIFYAQQCGQTQATQDYLPLFTANLIGLAWQKLGEYDSARHFFEQTRVLASDMNAKGKCLGWKGIALGNMGTCWLKEKKYDQAIPLLQRGVDETSKAGLWDNAAGFITRLGISYLATGNKAQAAVLIPTARETSYRAADDKTYCELYHFLAEWYKANGQAATALQFRDSLAFWQDSVSRRLDKNQQTRAELAFAEARFIGEKETLKTEIRNQRIIRNSLFVFLGLGSVISILLIRQRQQKMKQRQQELEEDKVQALSALNEARAELQRFRDNILEKNSVIETLEEMKAASQQQAGHLASTDAIEQLRQSVILTEEGWQSFKSTFERAYPGFVQSLKDRFPDCTAAEYRLMMLEKLNLSTKEMAAMLGVSPETIRSTKSRLKRKIGGAALEESLA